MTVSISTLMHQCSNFSISSPTLAISCLFDYRHPSRCEVVFYCRFNLHFLMINDVKHIFICLVAISHWLFSIDLFKTWYPTYRRMIFCTCTYLCMYICKYIYIYPYICVCVCIYIHIYPYVGTPRWFTGKESTCQCRRLRFDPWVSKMS